MLGDTTSVMIVPHARVRNAMPATATAGVGGRSSTKRLTPALDQPLHAST